MSSVRALPVFLVRVLALLLKDEFSMSDENKNSYYQIIVKIVLINDGLLKVYLTVNGNLEQRT